MPCYHLPAEGTVGTLTAGEKQQAQFKVATRLLFESQPTKCFDAFYPVLCKLFTNFVLVLKKRDLTLHHLYYCVCVSACVCM